LLRQEGVVKQPNIIFFLADDLGWRDLTCTGSEFYETPSVDRIRSNGMMFTDAYAACPVCSPTRASILTGKYPARLGITDWIDWFGHIHPVRGKLVDVPYRKELSRDERTIAHSLRAAGYATWHIGKWHLGSEGRLPTDFGFDVNIGGGLEGSPGQGGYFSPWTISDLSDTNVPEGTYLTDYLGDAAVKLIQDHAASDADPAPFYLSFPFYQVHTPIQGKPTLVEKYEEKRRLMGLDAVNTFEEGGFFPGGHKKDQRILRRLVQSDPVYAAMVESLDQNVGKVLDALDDLGMAEDTIIFFTSDNGGLATSEGSPTCNSPLAEGKGWMYEGGTREPLLVSWPGVIEPGSVSSGTITSPDFYPTILELTGADPDPEQHVDGTSFADLLKGDTGDVRGPMYWHYPHYGNQGGTPGASVRDRDWKLIRFFEDGHEELYNLKEDIGETKNLADEEPEKRAELSGLLTGWQGEIEALIPQPNPDYVPWEGREPCAHFAPKN
jgi:arylsulfatase A-like enzyme